MTASHNLIDKRPATTAPVIDFAAHKPHRAAQPSAVQTLCAKYEATLAAFKTAHSAFARAEDAAHKARPRPDSLLRPTKRNLADVESYIPGKRRTITSGEIRRAIESLRKNTVWSKKTEGTRIITICEAGFPLTPKQNAQLKRLEAKLPLALAYEAKCEALHTRFKVEELNDAAQIPSSKLGPLAERIASLPSRNRSDLLAKARICEIDPDMAEVSEDIGLSLAKDFARLAASSLI